MGVLILCLLFYTCFKRTKERRSGKGIKIVQNAKGNRNVQGVIQKTDSITDKH